jgi:2',3'-cyclic-nucleotide 2'-phosphodiesterase/3'-nucleotidase/5'-nucleotidase
VIPNPSRTPRRAGPLAVIALAAAAVGAAAGPANRSVELEAVGTHASGTFAGGGAEIVRYDKRTRRVFAVNASTATVDVLDAADPTAPTNVGAIDVAATLAADPAFTGIVAGANGIAVHRGVLAVAVEANPKTDNGWAAFYRTDTLELLGWVEAGALPDMITFTPNGRLALVANEGEPNGYGQPDSVDPEGSVTVVRIKGNFKALTATTIDFTEFDGEEDALRAAGVRIFGPGATAAQDLEPEYIAVAPDNRTAYVTLQENNAVAVLDLKRLRVDRILPLGWKDHSLPGNGLDGSDRDGEGSAGAIRIANWPVRGLYMPDGIAVYRVRGRNYFVTANEGDSRQDWFEEEARVKDLVLDPAAFPDAVALQDDDDIGRLTVTTTLGDTDDDGDFDALYAFGGRSFSIRDEDGELVFDSGDAFETMLAAAFPANFNSDHEANNFDNRSDNKGPEPEGIALGKIRGRTYAFVGLERAGGIVVYDITDPAAPTFVQYLNNRDFSGDPEAGTAGDLGPEGLEFVPAGRGAGARPMLIVGNEVSGTTTLYDIESVLVVE